MRTATDGCLLIDLGCDCDCVLAILRLVLAYSKYLTLKPLVSAVGMTPHEDCCCGNASVTHGMLRKTVIINIKSKLCHFCEQVMIDYIKWPTTVEDEDDEDYTLETRLRIASYLPHFIENGTWTHFRFELKCMCFEISALFVLYHTYQFKHLKAVRDKGRV